MAGKCGHQYLWNSTISSLETMRVPRDQKLWSVEYRSFRLLIFRIW